MDRARKMPDRAKGVWRIAILAAAAGLAAVSCAAQVPRITDVTIEKFADRVELTARSDLPMTYKRIESPGKIHAMGIEIPAVMDTSAFHQRGIHSGGILSVRSVQYRAKPPLARLMASCSESQTATVNELQGGRVLQFVVWKSERGTSAQGQSGVSASEPKPQREAVDPRPGCVARPESACELMLASAPGSTARAGARGHEPLAEPPEAVQGWSGSTASEPVVCVQHSEKPGMPVGETEEEGWATSIRVAPPQSTVLRQEKLAANPGLRQSPAVAASPAATEPEKPQTSVDPSGEPGKFAGDIGRFAVEAAVWAMREITGRGQIASGGADEPSEEVAPFKQLSVAPAGGSRSLATPPPASGRQERLAPRLTEPKAKLHSVRRAAQAPGRPPSEQSRAISPPGQIEERVAASKQEMVFTLDEESGAEVPEAKKIDLDFVDSEIVDVVKAISVQSGVNVVAGPEVEGKITLTLTGVTVEEALNYVSRLSGYQFAKVGRAYVVGTPAGIRAVSDETAARPKVSVFSLKNVTADTVVAVLAEQIPGLTVSKGAAEGVETVIVSGSEADVGLAGEIIEAIDAAPAELAAGWSCEIYSTSHADPVDLIRILGELVPSVNAILGPMSAFKGGQATGRSTGSLTPSGTSASSGSAIGGVPQVGGATPGPASGGTASSVTTSGPASNMLILTGSEGDLTRAKDILCKIDVPQRQVLIQVKVTDVSLDDTKELGFDWSWSSSTITEMIFTPTGAELPDVTVTGSDYTPWHFRRTPQAFTVVMDALFQSGEAKLLANPSVAVMSNREASFFIGDKILYPVIAGISQGTTIYNVNTEEVGIGIDVTPQIGSDDTITLYIHPYVSSITSYLQTPQGDYPQTSRRETETQIMVKDGETVVIGGLLRDNEIQTLRKFPLLGDLPLLGEIFRHRSHQKVHSEVMIMITCEIIKN